MADRLVLLDTSFVIALENRNDPYHIAALALDRLFLQEEVTLLLHWGIVLEIGDGYARLGRREKGVQILQRFRSEDGYQLAEITETVLGDAIDLYRSRLDKEWGLTDCVSFALMKSLGITEALTADQHFRQAGFIPLLLDFE